MTNILTKLGKWSALSLFTSAIILALLENYGIDITGIVESLGLPSDILATIGIGGLAGTGLALYTKSSMLSMSNVATTISAETIKYLAADKEKRIEQIQQELITQRTLKNVLSEVKTNNVLLARTIVYNDIMAKKNLSSALLTEDEKAKLTQYRIDTAKALSSLQFSLPDLIDKVGEENETI